MDIVPDTVRFLFSFSITSYYVQNAEYSARKCDIEDPMRSLRKLKTR